MIARLKERARNRWIRFVLMSTPYLRKGYLSTIAERNQFAANIADMRVSIDGLEATKAELETCLAAAARDAEQNTDIVTALTRLLNYWQAANTANPNSVNLVAPTREMQFVIQHKLTNVIRAVTGQPLQPDAFFDFPAPLGTSDGIH